MNGLHVRGKRVVDIGGGTTDISIISMNEIVVSKTINIAGNKFNEDIINFIKKKYKLLIGEKTTEEIKKKAMEIYAQKEQEIGSDNLRELERVIMLKIVDQRWMDHIDNMDELKNGIGLQGYGQKDPVVQYRLLGGEMFDEMNASIKVDVVKFLLNARKREEGATRQESVQIMNASLEDTAINSLDSQNRTSKDTNINRTITNTEPKVGRNDECPCGSGKKYKQCCGK